MKASLLNNKISGFTLIELIIVVIVISVLAVSAFSRFSGRSGFSEYTYQARLISALRNMQTRAMHDTRDPAGTANDYCFKININEVQDSFGPPTLSYNPGNGAATCSNNIDYTNPDYLATTATEMTDAEVRISAGNDDGDPFTFVDFSDLGRPITNTPSGDCDPLCIIEIQGEDLLLVCVESEGYIHACQ